MLRTTTRLLFVTVAMLLFLSARSFANPYEIRVDNSIDQDQVRPLFGVNHGVRSVEHHVRDDDPLPWARMAPYVQYVDLFLRAGISSVRTHDEGMDLSVVFQTSGCYLAHKEYWEVFDQCPPTGTPASVSPVTGGPHGLFDENYYEPEIDDDPNVPLHNTAGAWLRWRPLNAARALDDSCFNWFWVDRYFDDLYGSGIEVYLRLGEPYNGINYIGNETDRENYALAMGRFYDHIVTRNGHPVFLEIWNEPGGRFYTGPNACDNDVAAAEFFDLFERIRGHIDIEAPLGAPGFAGDQLSEFVDDINCRLAGGHDCGESFVFHFLNRLNPDQINFLAIHKYAGTYATAPAEFVDTIRSQQQALLDFCTHDPETVGQQWGWGLPADQCPPIHVNEWQKALSEGCDEDGHRWCTGVRSGAFTSSAITWLQYMDVEQAHFFSGFDPSYGLFYRDDESPPSFLVRASAVAMSLHSDLTDRDLKRVEIVDTDSGQSHSVLEAASANWFVTALAAGDSSDGELSVVVSNFSAQDFRDDDRLLVTISNVEPNGEYTIELNHLRNFPDEGATIAAVADHSDTDLDVVFVPDPELIEAVFTEHVVANEMTYTADEAGVLQFEVSVSPWGVLRADISLDVSTSDDVSPEPHPDGGAIDSDVEEDSALEAGEAVVDVNPDIEIEAVSEPTEDTPDSTQQGDSNTGCGCSVSRTKAGGPFLLLILGLAVSIRVRFHGCFCEPS